MKQRIFWIDNMRGICSFCVLLAHCGCCPSEYLQLFTPFFLASFFFLSGYCYKDRPLIEGLKRWSRKVLMPYFILASILIALSVSNLKLAMHGDISGYITDIKDLLLGRPLWFVSCLAVVQLYFLIVNKFVTKPRYYLLVSAICFTTMYIVRNIVNYPQSEYVPAFWYYDTAIMGLAFYVLGYLTGREPILKNLTLKWYLALVIITCYFVLALVVPKCYDVEFHFITNYYAFYPYFLLMSCLGIIVIRLLSEYINSRYITALGYNSLLLFASSGKINQIMQACHFDTLHPCLTDYGYSIIFCGVQGGGILILAYFVNKYCPFIVGK